VTNDTLRPAPVALALVVTALLTLALPAGADHDPEPRANIELGLEGPLRGAGPVSGYGFFLWNRPHFIEEHWYLRVIVAPVYLTSELIRDHWPAEGHAVGVGLGGGFFAYNFDEFRVGSREERESFWGHGGEVTLTYYRWIRLLDALPVEGQLRLRPQYAVYQRTDDTDPRFRLPADTPIYSARVGVRVGGEPPELQPLVSFEASAWSEVSYRVHADPFGRPEREEATEHFSNRVWGRLGGAITPFPGHTARVFLTAGTIANPDALTAFRVGSALPFRREFPLILRGYHVDEVFARSFWLVNLSYRFPLWPRSERVGLVLAADYARVDYLPGHELPRRDLRGVGADLSIALTADVTLMLGYGYGLDAPRGSTVGGHELHGLLELKF